MYGLLLTASYGIVNFSAKWRENIDTTRQNVGFKQSVYVTQMLFMYNA